MYLAHLIKWATTQQEHNLQTSQTPQIKILNIPNLINIIQQYILRELNPIMVLAYPGITLVFLVWVLKWLHHLLYQHWLCFLFCILWWDKLLGLFYHGVVYADLGSSVVDWGAVWDAGLLEFDVWLCQVHVWDPVPVYAFE